MPDEIEEGFEVIWVSLAEAENLLAKDEATTLEGSGYILPRDREFLAASKPFLARTK